MKQFRILVVDDEQRILNFLSSKLRVSGYEVLTASNGLEALESAVPIAKWFTPFVKRWIKIGEEPQIMGNDDQSLALKLHRALEERHKKIEEAQRIVILLDPEKETPDSLKTVFAKMNSLEKLRKVRTYRPTSS